MNNQIKTYKIVPLKTNIEGIQLNSSILTAEFVRNFYFEDLEIFESFFLILLNRNNRIKGYVKISQGGITGTVVDTQIIAFYAINTLSKAVILVHNHPSGNIQPSQADKEITQKVKTGLSLFDIIVLDHLILTKDDYYSFADNGDL